MEREYERGRNMFPRWRTVSRTFQPELESTENIEPIADAEQIRMQLDQLYQRWRDKPRLDTATDVVDCAVLLADPLLAIAPAQSILDDTDAMPAVKAVADFILRGQKAASPEIDAAVDSREEIVKKIRHLKRRTVDQPRNSLAWLEKARLQTSIADVRGAERSLKVALKSAPENRQILRAFARLMVHTDRPQEGHRCLAKSARLRDDPWLQAAEIALADAANIPPVSVRDARNELNNERFPAIHLSELAAAIGTLELNAGSMSLARKHLRQSLVRPTENSVSQVLWIKNEFDIDVTVETRSLLVPGAFEARVQGALSAKRWSEAVLNCRRWLNDEPFSLRAALNGSSIAGTFLWAHTDSLELAERGLVANPENPQLLNNKTVALIRARRLSEAEEVLNNLSHIPEYANGPFFMATSGLLDFAHRRIDQARANYERAIDIAAKEGGKEVQFRALTYWICEELALGLLSGERAHKVVKLMDVLPKRAGIRSGAFDLWEAMRDRAQGADAEQYSQSPEQLPLIVASIAG